MKPNLVLYHADCVDGWTSAWVATKALGDDQVELVPVHYGQDYPPVAGRHVYILDFSFPRDQLEEIHAQAKSLVVLDHHKTAQQELEGLPYCIFDMTKSGARLTWEYFYKSLPVPDLVKYVEDRDLWKWQLPWSKEVNAYIRLHVLELASWDWLNQISLVSAEILNQGNCVLRHQEQLRDLHIRQAWIFRLDGLNVPIVNATCLQSEIAGELAKNGPVGVGACFFINREGEQVVSLRSRNGGPDVSQIAKKFGGGGHPCSAGFKLQKGDWL